MKKVWIITGILFLSIIGIIISCGVNQYRKDNLKRHYNQIYLDNTFTTVSYNRSRGQVNLRAINETYVGRHIKVVCWIKDNQQMILGDKTVFVPARDHKKFSIWFFKKSEGVPISCDIAR